MENPEMLSLTQATCGVILAIDHLVSTVQAAADAETRSRYLLWQVELARELMAKVQAICWHTLETLDDIAKEAAAHG